MVRPVNDVPSPRSLTFDMLEDESRIFSNLSLIGNSEQVDIDTKTNSDLIKVTDVNIDATNTVKAKVSVDKMGNVSFIPVENYNGDVVFTYTVTDSAGAKGQNRVTLHMSSVNDAPVAKNNYLNLSNGIEDSVKIFSIQELVNNFTDVDGDALSVKTVSASYGGSVIIDNGQVIFTPVKDFNSRASFNYTVSDSGGATASSTASFEVVNLNDAPVPDCRRLCQR
jgi:3D (Asp-Asp-Asp) domain-containing protein